MNSSINEASSSLFSFSVFWKSANYQEFEILNKRRKEDVYIYIYIYLYIYTRWQVNHYEKNSRNPSCRWHHLGTLACRLNLRSPGMSLSWSKGLGGNGTHGWIIHQSTRPFQSKNFLEAKSKKNPKIRVGMMDDFMIWKCSLHRWGCISPPVEKTCSPGRLKVNLFSIISPSMGENKQTW